MCNSLFFGNTTVCALRLVRYDWKLWPKWTERAFVFIYLLHRQKLVKQKQGPHGQVGLQEALGVVSISVSGQAVRT
jgi:hypothetical protein